MKWDKASTRELVIGLIGWIFMLGTVGGVIYTVVLIFTGGRWWIGIIIAIVSAILWESSHGSYAEHLKMTQEERLEKLKEGIKEETKKVSK